MTDTTSATFYRYAHSLQYGTKYICDWYKMYMLYNVPYRNLDLE